MDPSSSTTPRLAHVESVQRTASGRSSRTAEKEKADDRSKNTHTPVPQRGTRYKDKFNSLREKYDQVNATRAQYERELAVANDKIKKLENECNLLLDAVDIAAPSQPNIMHYLTRDPIPPHYHVTRRIIPSVQVPLPEHADQYDPPPPPQNNGNHSRSVTNGTNGHDYGR